MNPIPAPDEDDEPDLLAEVEVGDLPRPEPEADRGERAAEHDRTLGPDAVEHPAADLGGDHEAEEEVEQDEAGADDADFPRPICAYSLAKKKIGMKTSIEIPRTRFSTRKGRIRKMLTIDQR